MFFSDRHFLMIKTCISCSFFKHARLTFWNLIFSALVSTAIISIVLMSSRRCIRTNVFKTISSYWIIKKWFLMTLNSELVIRRKGFCIIAIINSCNNSRDKDSRTTGLRRVISPLFGIFFSTLKAVHVLKRAIPILSCICMLLNMSAVTEEVTQYTNDFLITKPRMYEDCDKSWNCYRSICFSQMKRRKL